jgi:CheY-like chemotaxis protein
LTGRQETGDAIVASTLEEIARNPSEFLESESPRVALYRTFSRAWRTRNNDLRPRHESSTMDTHVVERLAALSPAPREAFLLVAMEEFLVGEASQILDCSSDELTRLLETAGEEIAEQIATTVLIIEDEPMISMDLAELVEVLGHRVVGTARTHDEAVRIANARSPGLVLADVQLADGSSGIAAANELLQSMSVPVIFITAYPERLLTGARPEPTFLVTKPYAPEMLKAMISQAVFFAAAAEPSALVA